MSAPPDTQQYTLEDIHQFSSTLVNEFAAHWTRFNYQAVLPQAPTQPSSAGFSITPQNTAGAGLPTIAIGNFFPSASHQRSSPRIDQVYQLGDNISKVVRQHAIKFGYDGRRFNVSNPFSARNNGSYSFSNSTATSPYTTGDSSLDFLFGIPGTFSQGSGATIQAQAFLNYLYAQDSWKVSNILTLDYGLGYSMDTPLLQKQYQGEAVICLIGGQQSAVFPTAPRASTIPVTRAATATAAPPSTSVSWPGARLCLVAHQSRLALRHQSRFLDQRRLRLLLRPHRGRELARNTHHAAFRSFLRRRQ